MVIFAAGINDVLGVFKKSWNIPRQTQWNNVIPGLLKPLKDFLTKKRTSSQSLMVLEVLGIGDTYKRLPAHLRALCMRFLPRCNKALQALVVLFNGDFFPTSHQKLDMSKDGIHVNYKENTSSKTDPSASPLTKLAHHLRRIIEWKVRHAHHTKKRPKGLTKAVG